MARRSFESVIGLRQMAPSSGFFVHRISRFADHSIDPFVNVDIFEMSRPTFPPHAHAGFSAVTYLLADSETGFRNRDSLGNTIDIEPGALHWTTAGSGLLHEEFPLKESGNVRGLQMFVDLPNRLRRTEPVVLHLKAREVPVLSMAGVKSRIPLGAWAGEASPLEPPTHVTLIEAIIEPMAAFEHTLSPSENAFVFVLSGSIQDSGLGGDVYVRAGDLATFTANASTLYFSAGPTGARIVLFAGEPFNQPMVAQGGFMAEDAAGVNQMIEDYRCGRMGHLPPEDHDAFYGRMR